MSTFLERKKKNRPGSRGRRIKKGRRVGGVLYSPREPEGQQKGDPKVGLGHNP